MCILPGSIGKDVTIAAFALHISFVHKSHDISSYLGDLKYPSQ